VKLSIPTVIAALMLMSASNCDPCDCGTQTRLDARSHSGPVAAELERGIAPTR